MRQIRRFPGAKPGDPGDPWSPRSPSVYLLFLLLLLFCHIQQTGVHAVQHANANMLTDALYWSVNVLLKNMLIYHLTAPAGIALISCNVQMTHAWFLRDLRVQMCESSYSVCRVSSTVAWNLTGVSCRCVVVAKVNSRIVYSLRSSEDFNIVRVKPRRNLRMCFLCKPLRAVLRRVFIYLFFCRRRQGGKQPAEKLRNSVGWNNVKVEGRRLISVQRTWEFFKSSSW